MSHLASEDEVDHRQHVEAAEAEAEAVEVVVEEANDEAVAVVAAEAEGVDEDDDEGAVDYGHETGPESEAKEPEKKKQKRAAAEKDYYNNRKESSSSKPSSEGQTKKKKKSKKKAPVLPGHTAVKGLTIPFRSVKRTMKNDKDVATVQNEAAIVATAAAELFMKKLADEGHKFATKHGRNTIRYEDLAEARANNSSLDFLDMLLP